MAPNAPQGAELTLRELLSIPYRVEAEAIERSPGEWVRRAAYPELPDCVAEAPTIEEALRGLERRRIEVIVNTFHSGARPPVPRPPLRDGSPEGLAQELGLAGLLGERMHDAVT